MFTPQEVSEKVFPKASFGSSGYSTGPVDEFLDALTEDYAALFKENVTLKAKLKVLAEKVEEYRSTEEAMRQALLTAQKMAAKLVQEAQTEKEKILADAQVEAQAEIHRLGDERRAAEKKLQAAQEKTAAFIRRSEDRHNKVVNIHATTQLKVVLVKPERFENASEIADHLKEKRTVVLNLESTNKDVARRLIDFLSGVAYAGEGKIKKVAANTYIITPYSVDIMGDLIDELENNGLYF